MQIEQSDTFDGVFIEVPRFSHLARNNETRCFRFDSKGNSEYAFLGDLKDCGINRARWYGHQYKRNDFEVLA